MSQTIHLIDKQKVEIVKLANTSLVEMIAAYKLILKEINKQIDVLVEEIRNAEFVDRAWLERQEELHRLEKIVLNELEAFEKQTLQNINTRIGESAEQAIADFQDFGEVKSSEVETEIAFNTLSKERVDKVIAILKVQKDRIRGVNESTFSNIKDQFIKGIALGYNPLKIAKEAKQATGLPLNRLMNIARTEILRTHREVHYELRKENDGILSGWVWYCALKSNTCPICWAQHGKQFANDQRLNDHNNGACTAVAQVKGFEDTITSGADEFSKLPVKAQLKILGPGRFALYRSGTPLGKFVKPGSDPRWGPIYLPAPLKGLTG